MRQSERVCTCTRVMYVQRVTLHDATHANSPDLSRPFKHTSARDSSLHLPVMRFLTYLKMHTFAKIPTTIAEGYALMRSRVRKEHTYISTYRALVLVILHPRFLRCIIYLLCAYSRT